MRSYELMLLKFFVFLRLASPAPLSADYYIVERMSNLPNIE
jgi:hypothetical protein